MSIYNRKYKELIADLGTSLISAIAPHDFEYYMISLELVDSEDRTIDYFTFPVLPQSIQKTEPKRTNIRQSASGITVLTDTGFTPQHITIKGNFGKSFKLLINAKSTNEACTAYSISGGRYDLIQSQSKTLGTNISALGFDAAVKTGFGALNILRAIISKSNGIDKTGRPFKLIFYNMALGESYLVVVPQNGLVVEQNMTNNGIWSYNLTLTIVSPLMNARGNVEKSNLTNLLSSSVQKAANTVVMDLLNKVL